METYSGHIRTSADAIKLFEACRIGLLQRVRRRLSEKERQLIKSGSVFVWDEREAGMRRWTDGKNWSPSRVSGSFLTYREMDGRRAGQSDITPLQRQSATTFPGSIQVSDEELDGENHEEYRYKLDGLVKQTFSITTSTGRNLHLISYYKRSDPNFMELFQPTLDPRLRHIVPSKTIYPDSVLPEVQGGNIACPGILSVSYPTSQVTNNLMTKKKARLPQHQYFYPHGYPWLSSPKSMQNSPPNISGSPLLEDNVTPNKQSMSLQVHSSKSFQKQGVKRCDYSPKLAIDNHPSSITSPINVSTRNSHKLESIFDNPASFSHLDSISTAELAYSKSTTPISRLRPSQEVHTSFSGQIQKSDSFNSTSNYSIMTQNATNPLPSGRIPSISSFVYAHNLAGTDSVNNSSKNHIASQSDHAEKLHTNSNNWQYIEERNELIKWRPTVKIDDEDHRTIRVLDRKFCV